MAWRGFIEESKRYMGYHDYKAKIDFWRKFPRAWVRFHWFTLRDWIRTTITNY